MRSQDSNFHKSPSVLPTAFLQVTAEPSYHRPSLHAPNPPNMEDPRNTPPLSPQSQKSTHTLIKLIPNTEAEIPQVIHLLTQSPPSTQRKTLEKYFSPSASFTHPFCRTGSFEGSRWLIWCIYRWYKIMSPRIEIKVDSVGTYVGAFRVCWG